ncbi:MAG TPA: hypothetical protein DER60_01115, partial [Syntrophomonas sp.]|nr:hypothetical protein [Syntrophomonas sp.]
IGALVSDTFSIPATATMVAVFNLRWPWWLVIGALYFGVEELFIKFGLYQQLWWKTLYTFLGLMAIFRLMKWWFDNLNKVHGRLISFLTLTAILYGVRIPLVLIDYAMLHGRSFSVQWIEALGRDSSAVNTLITLPAIAVLAFFLVNDYSKLWKAAWVALLFMVDLLLRRFGVVHTFTPWDNIYIIAVEIAVLLFGVYFQNILKQNTLKPTLILTDKEAS